ncbi:hypothetical protein [Streptomyces albus]|uniref:hypothetical protein n=1 Tax=Streptomyces albus TaxID=1888 RepID=UPI0024E0D555|nr:hypothetical protein [Streptomyces albus]GHJ21661.1 hypothetical protein TPA0909_32750 [Streptomyces albus]
MRGKHANAARNRRERVDLEQRAETAERLANKLNAELRELRTSSERRIDSLRAEVRQLVKDRANAVSPRLAEAEERIRVLTAERDSAIADRKEARKRWDALARNWVAVLEGMGLTGTEAVEALIASIEPDGKTQTINHRDHAKRLDTEQVIAIDRAQGIRRSTDPLEGRRVTDETLGTPTTG